MLLQSYHPVIQRLLEDAAQQCSKLKTEGRASKQRTVVTGRVVRRPAEGREGEQKEGDFISLAKIMSFSVKRRT